MLGMNALSRNISRVLGFDIIEAYNVSMPLRDQFHPATDPAVAIADTFVSRTHEILRSMSVAANRH